MNKFKSILSSTLIAVAVAACNGGGGGAAAPTPISKLYVAGGSDPAISAFDSATTADGAVPPDRKITGASTLLGNNYDVDYDAFTDSLYVGTWNTAQVLIWDGVSTADGDVAPSRVLAGGTTGIVKAHGVAVDSTRNLLYVSGDQGILVFDNVDTLDGDVAPLHTISGASTTISGGGELRMALDEANDRLYVTDPNRVPDGVLVFDNVSTLDGDVAPSRVIAGASTNLSYPWGIAIDVGRDLLYIGDQVTNGVYVFANASTADGDIAPTHAITGPTSTIAGVSDTFVDEATDTLYITDADSDRVLVWDNASTVDGDIAPSRAVSGGFSYPGGLVGAP